MTANNEIVLSQPIAGIGEVATSMAYGFILALFQAVGNIDINVKDMNIDMLSPFQDISSTLQRALARFM